MTGIEIISKVKKLRLPDGEYVVFGSCPMAACGIREANDIDMYVTTGILQTLKDHGWQQVHKGPGDEPYTYDVYEAHDTWSFSPYGPTLEHLLESAMVIDGIPFASLEEVRKWKFASGGTKNVHDVELIDKYLASVKQ